MNGKNLLVTKEAHKILKLYCVKNEIGLTELVSKIIINYVNNKNERSN